MRGYRIPAAARASALALAIASVTTPGLAGAAAKHPAPSPNSFEYSTTGTVKVGADPSSVTGPTALQFQGVDKGTYAHASGQPINLGQFVVSPSTVTPGVSTTYNDTPFEIQVRAPQFDKTSTVPVLSKIFSAYGRSLHLKTVTMNSLLIDGHLNGTVDASGRSDIKASVDSVKLGGLQKKTQDHIIKDTFPIRFNQLKLPTSWSMSALAPNPTLATAPLPAQSYASPAAAIVQPAPAAEMIVPSPTAPTPTPEPSTLAIFAVALGGLALARRRATS